MFICDNCSNSYQHRQSLCRHKKNCRSTISSKEENDCSSRSVDDTNSISIPLTPQTYRMGSGSGFSPSVPKRKHSVSERTKRPTVARLLEKVGDEGQAEKSKRQCRIRSKESSAEKPIHNSMNETNCDSDKSDYEMDNKDDGQGFVDSQGIIHTNLIETNMDDDNDSESSEEEESEDGEKVWLLIAKRSCINGCNALSSFKFFVQICQALKHDRTLRIIMDTIKKGREKYGMKLKEAVDYAVDKKKQLIYNAVDGIDSDDQDEPEDDDSCGNASECDNIEDNNNDDEDGDESEDNEDNENDENEYDESEEDSEADTDYEDEEIWSQLSNDAKNLGTNILDIVASYIRVCYALKSDTVYESIMETLEYALYINKEKDFDDALDFAIEKRKFLILQAYAKAKTIACKDGKQWALDSTEHKQ